MENIVKGDYNYINGRNVYSTDVTYINATNDVKQNHVYLTTIISYKTKNIIGYKLSKHNDLDLILDNIKDLKKENYKNCIIYSDRGTQYITPLNIVRIFL